MTHDFIEILNNLSFIVHFILLGLFTLNNLPEQKKEKLIPSIFWIFLIVIIYSIFMQDLKLKNGLAYGITNSFLIILCIIYFQQLFKAPPTIILIHSPAFWIINGIFFGMITTIPINFSGDYFLKDGSNESIQVLKKLGTFSYITMHLFFIKAYLCIIRPHRVL